MSRVIAWHQWAWMQGHTEDQGRIAAQVEAGELSEREAERMDDSDNELQSAGLRVFKLDAYKN